VTDQELQFHLYLRGLPVQEREDFDINGRLDIADFAIPELAFAFEEARRLINAAWVENAPRIIAPDGPTTLHLDYINSSSINATTFGYGGTYFVGLTGAMLEHFAKTCSVLWRMYEVSELLELKQTDEPNDALFQALLLTQLQFISSHEVGHLFHGHAQRNAFRTEYRQKMRSSTEDRTKHQAREVDADGYAVHLLLNNSLLSDAGEKIRARLKSSLAKEDCILTLVMLSIGSLFYSLEPLVFESNRVRFDDHPFTLARMNVVLREISNWCKLNLPDYVEWVTLARFQRVMTPVVNAEGSEERFMIWLRQGEFLLGQTGRDYMSDLFRFQDELRSEMNSFRWHIEGRREERPLDNPQAGE
jgi:hypothetical protein